MSKITCSILEPNPHYLKDRIEKTDLRLWQLRRALGGRPCESTLSRALSGIVPMEGKLETRIIAVLDSLDIDQ